jgi:GDP-4-dehydro-6-deoxy-D-mannose reductase
VTGVNGVVGSRVAKMLSKDSKYAVYGIVQPHTSVQSLIGVLDAITLLPGDVSDAFRMLDVIQQLQPRFVFHFAGVTPSHDSSLADHAQSSLNVNIQGTLNVLEALRRAGLAGKTRVFYAGSSTEYGRTAAEFGIKPIPETAALDAATPYGLSKAAAEKLALQYFQEYNIQVIICYNYIYCNQFHMILFIPLGCGWSLLLGVGQGHGSELRDPELLQANCIYRSWQTRTSGQTP